MQFPSDAVKVLTYHDADIEPHVLLLVVLLYLPIFPDVQR